MAKTSKPERPCRLRRILPDRPAPSGTELLGPNHGVGLVRQDPPKTKKVKDPGDTTSQS